MTPLANILWAFLYLLGFISALILIAVIVDKAKEWSRAVEKRLQGMPDDDGRGR